MAFVVVDQTQRITPQEAFVAMCKKFLHTISTTTSEDQGLIKAAEEEVAVVGGGSHPAFRGGAPRRGAEQDVAVVEESLVVVEKEDIAVIPPARSDRVRHFYDLFYVCHPEKGIIVVIFAMLSIMCSVRKLFNADHSLLTSTSKKVESHGKPTKQETYTCTRTVAYACFLCVACLMCVRLALVVLCK